MTLMSWDSRDFLIFVVIAGWKGKDGQGESCGLKLFVELFEGEFVMVI